MEEERSLRTGKWMKVNYSNQISSVLYFKS